MRVIFKSDREDLTREVFWVGDDGYVTGRMLDGDGAIRDEKLEGWGGPSKSLVDVFHEYGGTYSKFHVAEVDDLRSAFKYLGKAFDLVQTLPEIGIADLDPEYAAQ